MANAYSKKYAEHYCSKPDFSGRADKPEKMRKASVKTVQRPKTVEKPNESTQSTETAADRVAAIITAASSGITITALAEQTGYAKTKLYGLVHKLKKEGIIQSVSYGVYAKT